MLLRIGIKLERWWYSQAFLLLFLLIRIRLNDYFILIVWFRGLMWYLRELVNSNLSISTRTLRFFKRVFLNLWMSFLFLRFTVWEACWFHHTSYASVQGNCDLPLFDFVSQFLLIELVNIKGWNIFLQRISFLLKLFQFWFYFLADYLLLNLIINFIVFFWFQVHLIP